MTPEDEKKCTFLGFDLSTQKLKAVLLDYNLKELAKTEVTFDKDLSEFNTTGGFNPGPNPNENFVQTIMWVKAVDIVLNRLIENGATLKTVCAIGGSGQQHGSVYWSKQGIETLQNLDPEILLHKQIDSTAFVVNHSPIWMDGSTENQCKEMESGVGGRKKMVEITGSKCYPRFTGPQIRKIYQQQKSAYEGAERISLVSSFLASLFLGRVAPIDYADASGMNLFDIKSKTWSEACLNACAPDLENRLGEPAMTNTIVGGVSNYFVVRYGFPSTCKVSAFTGDNPSALSGMLVEQNWLVISLGTSDTVLMNLKEAPILEEGHVLCHPTVTNEFMGMLCFRNGSLVRTALRKSLANNKWDDFNNMLETTPHGNDGNMALHFQSKEIIPNAKGVLRWTKNHSARSPDAKEGVEKFDEPKTEIRALIEGQMMHHRCIAADTGFHFGENTKIVATGGASVNKAILQVIADVFNAPVYIQNASEAALMGAAFRAKYALYSYGHAQPDKKISYHEYIEQFIPNYLQRVCVPKVDSETIYEPMFERYREMAKILVEKSKDL